MLHNVSQEPRTIMTYVLVINLCCRRIFTYVESQQVETTCFIRGRWTTWTYRKVIHYIYFLNSVSIPAQRWGWVVYTCTGCQPITTPGISRQPLIQELTRPGTASSDEIRVLWYQLLWILFFLPSPWRSQDWFNLLGFQKEISQCSRLT